MTKSLSLFSVLVDSLGIFFNPRSEKYVTILFDNANTGYAEVLSIPRCSFRSFMSCPDAATCLSWPVLDYTKPLAAMVPLHSRLFSCMSGVERSSAYSVGSFRSGDNGTDFTYSRDPWYMSRVSAILEKLPKWRVERLSPPRVSQSEVK